MTPSDQPATWTTRYLDGRERVLGGRVRLPLANEAAAVETLVDALGEIQAVADLLIRLLEKCRGAE